MSDESPPAGFRNRGGDISRVEGFADCAFGFAVTLLVVSLDVPRTFAGLVAALQGIPAFALSFAILGWIWYTQYRFFRKYGLEDLTTVLLTLVLLFVGQYTREEYERLAALLLRVAPACRRRQGTGAEDPD